MTYILIFVIVYTERERKTDRPETGKKGKKMKELKKTLSLDEKVAVFEELLRESKSYYLYSKYEDDANKIANRALSRANALYGLNGACIEDSGAWEKARDLVL